MTDPRVSIITAAYQTRSAHLRAALASALAQSFPHIELLLSDDSPTDALRGVAEEIGDGRLRYRHNRPALGVAANHWRCIREARGEFIVILNHDDTLEPSFIERLLAPLDDHLALVLAFCDHWIIDDDGSINTAATERASAHYGRATLPAGAHQPFHHLFIRQSIPMAMGSMFRRAALPAELPAVAGPAYDLWLTYLLCRGGGGAWYIADRLSSWRAHPCNQTSLGSLALLRGAAECWSAAADDPQLCSVRAAVTTEASRGYYACARRSYLDGRRAESRAFAVRSLAARPSWRAMAAWAASAMPFTIGRRAPD